MPSRRKVVVVGYHEAELLDIACVVSTLQAANFFSGKTLYSTVLASPGGRAIKTAGGLVVNAEDAVERIKGPLDTLLVVGGFGYVGAMDNQQLIAHVRRLGREAARVASVCTGAGILAAAGLLDGRRAATHWAHSSFLSDRYPKVHFDSDPIFIIDDGVCTSAGVTAGLDLALSFVEADGGPDLARAVARQMVTYLQRPGNQAQMSMFTAPPAAGSSIVRSTVEYITANLSSDLASSTLADRVGVSERHLSRLFLQDLGVTPARFVRRVRIESAAHLLASTDLTVETIAGRCGFGTAETLRQAFQAHYGVAPTHYRVTQSRINAVGNRHGVALA